MTPEQRQAANIRRKIGYDHALSGRPKNPPEEPAFERSAYLAGHREGLKQKERISCKTIVT